MVNDPHYNAGTDPYINPATGILKNKPGLQNEQALERFEATIFQAHFPEATQYLKQQKAISLKEWQAVHKICFEDVYDWAGQLRTVQISKGNTIFAYPEHIASQANKYFKELNNELKNGTLTREKTTSLFIEINVIHPFREGNGRTQRLLFSEIYSRLGYTVDYTKTTQEEMTQAMIDGYNGNETTAQTLFKHLTTP